MPVGINMWVNGCAEELIKSCDNFSKSSIIITNSANKVYSLSSQGRYGTRIVVGSLDDKHDLRIIYVQGDDIITVITFYPVTKGRYG